MIGDRRSYKRKEYIDTEEESMTSVETLTHNLSASQAFNLQKC
jgi:hypothetical protein